MSRSALWLALALLLAAPSQVLGFSGPAMYAAGALEGGGGGRFFTGSVLDGYGCSVCHTGGPKPHVDIAGLPLDGYLPGATYDVQIRWANPELPHALTLEFVSSSGAPVQGIALAEQASIPPAERCDQSSDAEPAAYLFPMGQRRILGMSDCGAAAVRFRFTAPSDPEVTLTLAMVQSDSMGSPEGDGVLELRRTLERADLAARTATPGGCSVRNTAERDGAPSAWLALATLALALRGRRRASLLICLGLCSFGCIQPRESADLPLRDELPGGQQDAATDPLDAGTPSPVTPVDDGGAPPSGDRPSALSFEVLTKAQGGRYAPNNIGAIWIEEASGRWVKTLAVWAGVRERYLYRFRDASGGTRMDAVTSATLSSHTVHQASWDLTDSSRQAVPDGDYRLVVELTDRSAAGASTALDFALGPASFELSPPDEPYFVQMKLNYR
jgi:MYXO-CTERM domain-containing protein